MTQHLTDSVFQELADGENHAAAQEHLTACESCTAELASLRAFKSELAALPREVEPALDLFPAVRARITQPPKSDLWKIAAIALAATLALFAWFPQSPQPAMDPRGSLRDEMRGAETVYQHALDDLLADLSSRKSELDPKTVAAVEANLKVIDEAIRASREALERDPSSREAAMMVASAYASKLDVLRLIERTER